MAITDQRGRTTGQKLRFPESEHRADLRCKLTVELVGKDVLDAALHEQVLSEEMEDVAERRQSSIRMVNH